MIDMHSHILPNIDDGAKSIEEANNLIQEAKNAGFDGIVSTSHYIEGFYETDVESRKSIVNELIKVNNNFPIYLGNEIYLSENMIGLLKEKKVTTLNDTKYVLFEMPLNGIPMGLDNMVYDMLQNKLIPILAHPERYLSVQQNPEIIYSLIEKGVLMQGNYGSIIGCYGTKAQILIKKLLENNMLHFLGSDVHRAKTIYTKMPQILGKLNKIVGEESLEKLVSINPKLALENEKIPVPTPTQMKFTLKERIIMKSKK